MTAILWKDNKLFVDSFVEKGGEWMNVSNKVMKFNSDVRLTAVGCDIDDTLLGLTYTGARVTADRLGKALREASEDMAQSVLDQTDPVYPCDLDKIRYSYNAVIRRYENASNLGLMNFENTTKCLIIGLKANYIAAIGESDGIVITAHDKSAVIMMGSGEPHMAAMFNRVGGVTVPIRMMHYAMHMEPSCGGNVYQYEVLDDTQCSSGSSLNVTAMYTPPSEYQMRMSELLTTYESEPDLVYNQRSFRAARRAGLPLDYEIARQDDVEGAAVVAQESVVKVAPVTKKKARSRPAVFPTPFIPPLSTKRKNTHPQKRK